MSPDVRPAGVRWHIVGLLAIIAGLTYVDRLNLGIAGKYIQDQFHFDNQTMGWILGSFSLGYAIFHVPGGWLGDRFGPRRVLTLAILWFSVFTAATAIAPRLPLVGWLGVAWSFGITRFLMGVGESAALPVGNKIMGTWLGDRERAFGTSTFLAGLAVGGIIAPVIINSIAKRWGWQASFVLCGLLGVVVAVAWYIYARNRPEEHPRVNAAELAIILEGRGTQAERHRANDSSMRTPWIRILSSPSVWGLMISHICLVYGFGIFFTWFFIYLVNVRGLTMTRGSLWSSTPFIAGVIVSPFWGWLSDRAVGKFGKRRGRRDTVWLSVFCSAVLMWSGGHTANDSLAILQLAAAAGFNMASTAIFWTTCNDIAQRFSGSVSGAMTTFGSLGGWLSPILTARIATKYGWIQALDVAALVTLAGGLSWFFIDASRSVDQDLRNPG